jgi:putative transposase
VKFAFIKEHRRTWPAGVICRVLGVSRAGFFAWLKRPLSGRGRRRRELAVRIRAAHREHRGVYGSPRICAVLRGQGEKVCENTVARLMKEQEIRARIQKRFVPRTTDGQHAHAVAKNVLDRDFAAARPNRKWVADITYVPTGEGWLYMAAVMDLCSRRIVGWSMADHMEAELVSDALSMALARRRPNEGLLHHSDRGVQYACDEYQKLLAENGMECSMSGKGDCWDNAVMESFWATLKTELIHQEKYATREQARASIFEYVEAFYNRKRLHSSLDYLSPEAFEAGLN